MYKVCTVVFLLAVLTGCHPEVKVLENPLVEASTNSIADVKRIELSDSATVLTMTVSTSAMTLSLEKGTAIIAEGEEFGVKGFEGVPDDLRYRIPESGVGEFGLVFGKIPEEADAIDLKLRLNGRDVMLYGIDLTGRKRYGFPEGLPSSLRKVRRHMPLPEPVFECGETELTLHLLHYRKEVTGSLDVVVKSLFANETFSLDIDPDTATAECRFMLYGPAYVRIYSAGGNGSAWVAPGDKVDLYLDMRQSGSWSKTRVLKYFSDGMSRDERDENLRRLSVRNIYATGRYGDYTNAVDSDSWCDPEDRYSLALGSDGARLYEMPSGEYADYVMSRYRSVADSIAAGRLSRATREMLLITLSQETLDAIVNGDRLRNMNWLDVRGLTVLDVYRKKIKLPQIDTMTIADYEAVKDIDRINSPEMLLGMKLDDFSGSINYSYPSVEDIAGFSEGFIPDLNSIAGMSYKAENAGLSAADFRILEGMDNPFYLEALKLMQEKAEDALAAKAVIQKTPDAEGEALFDAIIAPHKGKVVLVDFWNTWCKPCRAAIGAMEPLKKTELASDDLVWIYIADETSPERQYRMMIPSIEGLHYYLTLDQKSHVAAKFGITEIPAYVLVDKDGTYVLRNDFVRDRDLMVRTIRELL